MSRRIRILYFVIVVFIFLVIAPLLLFYAAGWRYDFSHRSVEKIGGVIIETEPRGAIVLINGLDTEKKTPCTINNLLPGQYTITLKKENYATWAKPTTVESGITNRLTDIPLLKEVATVSPLLSDTFSQVSMSDGTRYAAAYGTDKPISIIDVPAARIIYQSPDQYDITQWQWSPDETQAFFKTKDNEYFLLTIAATPELQNMATLYPMRFLALAWSQGENSIMYARAADGLYRLNLFQKTSTAISNDPHTAFSITDLLFAEVPDQLNILTSNGEVKNHIPLRPGYNLQYIGPSHDLVMILDKNHQSLFIYNTKNNTFEQLTESVIGLDWNQKTDQVLFYNALELWAWNLQKNEKTLILRTSDSINQAQWLKGDKYIAVLHQSGNLQAVEAVSTDRNNYEMPMTGITSMRVDESSAGITFLANGLLYVIQL